jgi:NitT/TauT family transport system permease protein
MDVLKAPMTARILFPIVVIGAWWLIAVTLQSDIFPEPWRVAEFMWDELRADTLARRNLYVTFALSLGRLFAGFAIAMVVGTIIGLGMGIWKAWDAFFHDWVVAVLAMPALAWALFTGLVFGFGNWGPIVTVILAGIPFVIINVREGVKNTPKELVDMARAFGATQQDITRHVVLPSLMPFMFAAIRYGFSIGWKGLVIAEVFASDKGAGWTIKYWYDAHRAHGVVAYALFFVIFALILEKLVFEYASNRAFKWRPQAGALALVEEAFEKQLDDEGLSTSAIAAAESAASDRDFGTRGEG